MRNSKESGAFLDLEKRLLGRVARAGVLLQLPKSESISFRLGERPGRVDAEKFLRGEAEVLNVFFGVFGFVFAPEA